MLGAEMQTAEASLPASLRGHSGPKPRTVHTFFVRPLTRADIVLLLHAAPAPRPRPIQEMRQSHHRLARLVAAGKRPIEISAQTGYSTSTIHSLQKAPAFRQLVAFYQNAVGEAYANALEVAGDLSVDAMAELRARLESEPESFSNMELIKMNALLMDRTGHGPTRNINVTNAGDVIRALKEQRDSEQDFIVLDPSEDTE